MYCRRCGRRMDYDAPICKECEEELNSARARVSVTPTQDEQNARPIYTNAPAGDAKEGFGKALAATIMGGISIFVFIISIALMYEVSVAYLNSIAYGDTGIYFAGLSVGFVLLLASLGLAIPSLIMGIQSIKCFVNAKKEGRVKPVGTLVCGIIGLASSAITLSYVAIFMLAFASAYATA
ncbi:MAG: hypothetical protein IKC64_00600 [Clostridia bacterium]|nr:hypothetical protein [Clostridia bacterium]